MPLRVAKLEGRIVGSGEVRLDEHDGNTTLDVAGACNPFGSRRGRAVTASRTSHAGAAPLVGEVLPDPPMRHGCA